MIYWFSKHISIMIININKSFNLWVFFISISLSRNIFIQNQKNVKTKVTYLVYSVRMFFNNLFLLHVLGEFKVQMSRIEIRQISL